MTMASPIDTTLQGVVWKKTLEEEVLDHPHLRGEEVADLVVVGAGFCGLNIALHAAKAGLNVILLEAGRVGGGASGRNGGYNVPHFPGALAPSAVEKILGPKKGRALAELVVVHVGPVAPRPAYLRGVPFLHGASRDSSICPNIGSYRSESCRRLC